VSDMPTTSVSLARDKLFDFSAQASAATRQFLPFISQSREPEVRAGGRPGTFRIWAPADPLEGIENKLFKHLADLKVMVAQVAMHFSQDERGNIFAALDRLLSVEHWEDDSVQIDLESFRTFLRFLIFSHPIKFPNMGVSPRGGVLAGWHSERKSVHSEFLPQDFCTALMKLEAARGPETLAWRGSVARLKLIIQQNHVSDCIE
jgi:hypothetical protein